MGLIYIRKRRCIRFDDDRENYPIQQTWDHLRGYRRALS
ncbi:hypothetical protein ASZ90_014051 [hydrocarbon metagenome]|uniref:Uncharacterized protein n=1 Tax=hydrocarbon metagenome TaxID=938273 RepID=A0A0W8F5S9_9ZZZZ